MHRANPMQGAQVVHRRARHLRLRDVRGQQLRAVLHQLRQREAPAAVQHGEEETIIFETLVIIIRIQRSLL